MYESPYKRFRADEGTEEYNDTSAFKIHPINTLTPYERKWTIRARVIHKTPVHSWSNSRGEGKLFSMDLLDESGEIHATAFNDCVDNYFDLIEDNKVYYISKGILKAANKMYTSTKNDYELSFTTYTSVIPCEETVSEIPMMHFDFLPIQQLKQVEKDTAVDIIGICKSTSEVQTITTRSTNKEQKIIRVQLIDETNTEVTLTIWGDEAEKFDGSSNPIVAIKCGRVSDFSGRSINANCSSGIQLNPDIPEARKLRKWYDREGYIKESHSISNWSGHGNIGGKWKTLAQVKNAMLSMDDKPIYYTTKAIVLMVRRDNCLFIVCPYEDCNQKVIVGKNGMYKCAKCKKEYDHFKWRLFLFVNIADFSENLWVACFQEAAESLLGISAQDLGDLKKWNKDRYNEVLSKSILKTYMFKMRTKIETVNEEKRLKTAVITADSVEYLKCAQQLLTNIKEMKSSGFIKEMESGGDIKEIESSGYITEIKSSGYITEIKSSDYNTEMVSNDHIKERESSSDGKEKERNDLDKEINDYIQEMASRDYIQEIECSYYTKELESSDSSEDMESSYCYTKETESSDFTKKTENSDYSKEMESSGYSKEMESSGYSKEMESSDYTKETESSDYTEEIKNSNFDEEAKSSDYTKEMESSACFPDIEYSYDY